MSSLSVCLTRLVHQKSIYSHTVAILNTKTLEIEYIENPHAYNFYKIQIDSEADLKYLERLKNQAVVSVKCDSSLADKVKLRISELSDKIVESRIILIKKFEEATETTELDLSVDHLARFIECCKANIELTTMLDEELSEVCK